MSATSKKSEKNSQKSTEATADVLYQRLGDKWFAFSVVDEEVYMAAITPEDLATIQSRNEKPQKE